jgi:hypothetical protein
VSSPIEEVDVECPHCGRFYCDSDRLSVDAEMVADAEYMRRVNTGVCPHCGTTVGIGGAGSWSVRRPGEDAIIERGCGSAVRMVRIDADTYIPFEHLSDEQKALRSEIRDAVGALAAGPEEVLQASFHGDKPARSDVENLLIYNIGAAHLRSASRHGLRFELAPQPAGAVSRFGYRYGLDDRTAGFHHWVPARRLAWWDGIEVRSITSDKLLAGVWLALRRGVVTRENRRFDLEAPFSVGLVLRPPAGSIAAPAALIKGLVDGVICAFQSHRDIDTVVDVAQRLARTLPADEEEIQHELLGRRPPVLGAVRRLVHARGSGVAWAPADEYCVAGQLLLEPPVGDTWTLSGQIHEANPR